MGEIEAPAPGESRRLTAIPSLLRPPRQRPTLQTANVLNKLPKSLHGKAKRALQDIWMAETKNEAVAALDAFADSYAPKIRQGGRMSEQRSRYVARLLRLPRRALEALMEHESDREHVRHGATPHDPIEGLPLEQDRARDGLQAHRGRAEKLALPRRPQQIAKVDHRCEIRRRIRGRRPIGRASSQSRLIHQAVNKTRQ